MQILRLTAIVILATWLASPGLAAPCTGPDMGPQASAQGNFDHAADLSPDNDIDRIAALEQQGWREFRWDVVAEGCFELDLTLDPEATPADWPDDVTIPPDAARATLHVSADGETFLPLTGNTVVAAGQQISVLIAQKVDPLPGDHRRFFPAAWQFTVTGQAAETGPEGPLLEPLMTQRALGCAETGCGEGAIDPTAPFPVADRPEIDSDTDPMSPAEPDTANDGSDGSLAAELQTELARVGCYEDTIDGLWGPASRRAMTNFNHWAGKDAVVEKPTPKALVTVARTPAPVCGVD